MNDIALTGCTAEPIISYLDALGVFRTLGKKKQIRGMWKEGVFHIMADMDKDSLVGFFLNDYVPTPVVSPWNGGSGFNKGDKSEVYIEKIKNTVDERFEPYREVIRIVSEFPEFKHVTFGEMIDKLKTDDNELDELLKSFNDAKKRHPELASLKITEINDNYKDVKGILKKINTKYLRIIRSENKQKLVDRCRSMLPDSALEWIDTALLIDSTEKPKYPPLLGSGGNDGNLDFSGQFMRYVLDLLLGDKKDSEKLLRNALFGDPVDNLKEGHVGMFDPGNAGGSNQGIGVEDKDVPINPWKFVLAIEGAMVMPSGIAKRMDVSVPEEIRGILSSPFTVRGMAAGDPKLDSAENIKAEVWLPIWDQPATYEEVRMLFAEGRADVQRGHARNTLEFAEAVSSLGIDRGLTGFYRYSLVPRRGKSFIALPTGNFPVRAALQDSDLIRELEGKIEQLERIWRKNSKKSNVNNSTAQLGRRLHDLMLRILKEGGSVNDFTSLVRTMGMIESKIKMEGERKESEREINMPVHGLKPEFLLKLDTGRVEVRLAMALASIAPTGGAGYIRANLEQVQPMEPGKWGTGQVAWYGNSLQSKIISVIKRRMLDSQNSNSGKQGSSNNNPFYGLIRIQPEDVIDYITGMVDERLLEDLLFGLMWIDWRNAQRISAEVNRRLSKYTDKIIPLQYALLKSLFLPNDIYYDREPKKIKSEMTIINLLVSDRTSDACKLARRRLLNAVLPVKTMDFTDDKNGSRFAASMIFPINDYKRLIKLLI